MKTQAKVVIIGGGVVGASVLYHLAKAGWTDTLLIERAELTAGSTWHAAGGVHTVNGDATLSRLQQYTIQLYREIEEESGQSCGVHLTGGIMLAGTPERLDWLKMVRARGRTLGMDLELLSAAEAKRLFPLMDERHFVGALYDPVEGHVDPYGVTHAYAKCAQSGGAAIERHCRVTDLLRRPDGAWDVVTEKGTVVAEHVVNAGGLWAREVGRMVGLELPVLAMEHHYLITEDMPELVGQPEQLHCIDFEGEIYMRQERGGMLMGTYERDGKPWSERVTPWDFGQNLLPDDLDRISASLEVGFAHFPAIATAGLKKVVNGPFTFTPDGNPLVGPVKGLPGFWTACGVMAGFSQGGGVGLALSQLDGRGRSRPRRLGHGRRPLRRLDHHGLYQRQGARELFAPLPHPLPQRGAAGRPAAAHHAGLRRARRRGRAVRRLCGARGPAVVRGARHPRGARHVPALRSP